MWAGKLPTEANFWIMEDEVDPLCPPELARPAKKPASILFLIVKWLVLVTIPAAVLIPNFFQRGHRPMPLSACRNNVKNVATALEMYASDNAGHYPQKLEQLLPGNYLKALPTCPAARRITFTDYQTGHDPDSFTFSCVGDNHARGYGHSALNCPGYNSYEGMVEPAR